MDNVNGYNSGGPISSGLPEDQLLMDSFDDDPDDAMFWLEQDLLSDFDPDLRRPLYDDGDASNDLTSELRINELVSNAVNATALERRQISEFLEHLEPGRLRYWLPRLRRKSWTGRSLLLFLRFREVWARKDAWWESTYWDTTIEVWYPVWNRANLTLESTYLLIHNRIDCQPEKVIDDNWIEEWLNLRSWERGYCYSFASYAVWRSGFSSQRECLLHLNQIQPNLED